MNKSLKSTFNFFKTFPAVYYTLIMVLVINIVMNPKILSERGINNLFLQIMPAVLCVMGQACAMLIGEMDLSVGSVVSLTTVILALTMKTMGPLLSILLVLAVTLVIGLINGALVGYLKLPGIVVTLTMQMMAGGIALMMLPVPGGYIDRGFGSFFTDNLWLIPNSALVLACVLLIWLFIRKHKLGTYLYATGGNYYSAYSSGIPVKEVKLSAFLLCALLSMLAGMLIAAKSLSGDADIGARYSTVSIAGAVLGGVSFLGGVAYMGRAVAGGIVITVLVNILFFMNISSYVQYIVQGVILIIAVIASLLNENKRAEA